jgi:hypothetical protein
MKWKHDEVEANNIPLFIIRRRSPAAPGRPSRRRAAAAEAEAHVYVEAGGRWQGVPSASRLCIAA